MSDVDVIVPCYNYAHFLRQCVDSVLGQTGVTVHVLVIDDASSDETHATALALAASDARVSVRRHPRNLGHIATYNEGLAWASARYTLLLSADDYLLPGALDRSARLLDRYERAGFAFGKVLRLSERGFESQTSPLDVSEHNEAKVLSGYGFIELSGAKNLVRTPTVVVRTALYRRLGGYRPDLPHAGDMEMWLRLAAAGDVGFVNADQAVYRRHSANMSLQYMRRRSLEEVEQRRAALECFFSHHRDLPRAAALRQRAFTMLALEAVGLASAAFNDADLATSAQLSEFALQTSPSVQSSLEWKKFAFKRQIGVRAWRRAQPAVAAVKAARRHPSRSDQRMRTSTLQASASSADSALLRVQYAARRVIHVLISRWHNRMAAKALQKSGEPALEPWDTPIIPSPAAARDEVSLDRTDDVDCETDLAQPAGRSAGAVDGASSLRCLLVTPSLGAGGMDEVVVFLARHLPQFGLRVAVLNASSSVLAEDTLSRWLLAHGVETVALAHPEALQWIDRWRPDVINGHGAPSWVLEAAGARAIPYVHTLHGMHSFFNVDAAQEAHRAHGLAGIIAVSDLVRAQYLALNPSFPSGAIVTIPNAVDHSRRAPVSRERIRRHLGLSDEYLFLSLARYCVQKNTYGLISAFCDVAELHPDAHLVLAGHADDPAYMRRIVAARSTSPCRTRIHLRTHTSNPMALLAAADGFVLDSFFEGWPLAPMEALHAGLPVVLSEVGGAREQVGSDSSRGFVVPNPLGDPMCVDWDSIRAARYTSQSNRQALVSAMSSLVRDRFLWQSRRQLLMDESRTRFNPHHCARAHAIFLSKAARSAETVRSAAQCSAL